MASTDVGTDARRGGGALGVRGASRVIGKPAQRKPVIIYMASPKIIHVEADEFLPLVQRLTGPGAATSGDIHAGASSPRKTATSSRARPAPVRVKARALNRHGPAVSVSVAATRPPSPTTFLFEDLSPTLRGAASPSWLRHGGDHFLSPGPVLGSPSGYLDIFGPLSWQQ